MEAKTKLLETPVQPLGEPAGLVHHASTTPNPQGWCIMLRPPRNGAFSACRPFYLPKTFEAGPKLARLHPLGPHPPFPTTIPEVHKKGGWDCLHHCACDGGNIATR